MIRGWMRMVLLAVMVWAHSVWAQDRVNPKLLYNEALLAHDAGRYGEAVTLLNQCIKINPGMLEAYYARGAAREQLNDPAGALTDYSIYLEKHDDDTEAHLARGILHFRQGHFDLAKADFVALLTLPFKPTNTVFYRQSPSGKGTDQVMTVQSGGKAYLLNYIGLCESRLKHYPTAIAYFDSALVLEPKGADYYVNRGIAKEGLNDTTARSDYLKALALDPNHGIAQHNLSVLKSRKGDKAAAEDMLSDMIEADSTMLYAYIQRGYQRLEAGYYKGAVEDYTGAIRMDQTNPELYLARGIAREKLKDYEGAFSDYTRAIDLRENMEKAWLNRGNVLSKLNRLQDAIEDYTVAITYVPDFAAAFYNRGIARYKLKQYTEACADVTRAEQLGFQADAKTRQRICSAR
jgi:tetratricopeptide (TPR) repeat protein